MLDKLKLKIKGYTELDFFSPAIFFPFVLIIYHLFGNLFDLNRSAIFNITNSTFPLLILSLIIYYIMFFLVTKKKLVLPTISKRCISQLFLQMILVLTIVGFLSLAYMFLSGQIGILDESVRRHISPKLMFLSSFFWFGYLVLVPPFVSERIRVNKRAIGILCFTGILILTLYLIVGYRTNLFIILFTLLLFCHYRYKQISTRMVVILLLTLSVLLSLFGYARVVTEDKTIEFNQSPMETEIDVETQREIVLLNKTPKWIRVATAEFVNGKIVLSRIIEYTKNEGPLNGKLHWSSIETIMPGINQSPRTIVTEIVNSYSDNGIPVTRVGRTTTPGLIGQLFLDGGYLLVILGFGIISFVLSTLYNKVRVTRNAKDKVAYSFISTLLVISIHTGLLDINFYIFFVLAIVYSMTRTTTSKLSI